MGRLLFVALLVCGCKNDPENGGTTDAATGDPPQDSITTATIGAAGGTVTNENGTMVIPPGALSTEVAITVFKTAEPAPFGSSPSEVYLLLPEGQTFASPVTFTLHLAATPPLGYRVMWSKLGIANPTLVTDYEQPAVTVAGADVSATNTHFSHVFGAVNGVSTGGYAVAD